MLKYMLLLLTLVGSVSAIPADINSDSKVDLLDVQFVVLDFGKVANFSPGVDLAPPMGQIDLFDIMVIVRNWGIVNATNTTINATSNSTIPLSITTHQLGSCIVGTQYSLTFNATGGKAPYAFNLSNGAFPDWSVFTSNTLSGNASAGNYSFTIKVTDADGSASERNFSLLCIVPSNGEHAYFDLLRARPDLFAAYSLRDNAQVLKYKYNVGSNDLAYIYPNDPDPRKQDAMRMLTRANKTAPAEGLRLPLGAHHPKNLFVVEERWWGAEMNYNNTKIGYYKGDPYFESGKLNTWFAIKTMPLPATQNTHNLPPGGPYVLMIEPQFTNAINKYSFPLPLRLPYNAPLKETRNYGQEAAGPRDTSAGPEGAEFGAVAERWTRIWHFFERAPEEDWESNSTPVGPRAAYRWSMWAADTERNPIRILDGVVISIYPNSTGLSYWRMHMGVGNAYQDIPPERGELLAYARNIVVLHGITKPEVLELLQKP